MIDAAVGIDIGTSYIKAVARAQDGSVVAVSRVRSPRFKDRFDVLVCANEWWTRLKHVVRGLLKGPTPLDIKSICVSAIAPTLTIFDMSQAQRAYAIFYTSLAELENGKTLSQCDSHLTDRRLLALSRAAHQAGFVTPCITDLVGYVNWLLTKTFTINSISLTEAGIRAGDINKFAVINNSAPLLVAPSQQIGETTSSAAVELGIKPRIPVCGGCSDTMSSVVGAGLKNASETMLYLGTFGSLMCLEYDVDILLDRTGCPNAPFRWLLSVPGLGPKLELIDHGWSRSAAVNDGIHILDNLALQASPGAGGTLFLLPRWKSGMTPTGKFEIVPDKNGNVGDVRRQARAVLEGLAYAVLVLERDIGKVTKAAGGGARSRIWLDILSMVLGIEIHAREMTWEATGAADIAARLAWRSLSPTRPSYVAGKHGDSYQPLLDDNLRRIKEKYHELEWL